VIQPQQPLPPDDTALELDLIRRYAVPGPRYTSYPPANRFHDRLEEIDLPAALAEDNADPTRPLSLYLHLPFCESRCWYCGCTTIITRRQDWADAYLRDLAAELTVLAPRLDRHRPVTQLHFGGGTPTFFNADQLERLGALLRTTFGFADAAECSIEIDPRWVTPEQVEVLAAMGINRASLGIQDTNTKVQEAIHRVQPHELNRRAVDLLRDAGIDDINFDLIYGLPGQTPDSIEQTLDDVLPLAPDRLSVFSYAHVPWIKPAQRIFDKRGQLPEPEAKLAMFGVMRRRLREEGYIDIGLDHFARPDDPLAVAQTAGTLQRNFQGYSTCADASLYGLGISSISATADVYWQNPKSLAAWREAIRAGRLPVEKGYRLNAEDHRVRRLIMGIMCDRRLDFTALGKEWGMDVATRYVSALEQLEPLRAEGLVDWDERSLTVAPRGTPLLRVIAMAFDPALATTGRAHALTV
jgi:oxygen-independent coproporphyrinogen-3 oxidase